MYIGKIEKQYRNTVKSQIVTLEESGDETIAQ